MKKAELCELVEITYKELLICERIVSNMCNGIELIHSNFEENYSNTSEQVALYADIVTSSRYEIHNCIGVLKGIKGLYIKSERVYKTIEAVESSLYSIIRNMNSIRGWNRQAISNLLRPLNRATTFITFAMGEMGRLKLKYAL